MRGQKGRGAGKGPPLEEGRFGKGGPKRVQYSTGRMRSLTVRRPLVEGTTSSLASGAQEERA